MTSGMCVGVCMDVFTCLHVCMCDSVCVSVFMHLCLCVSKGVYAVHCRAHIPLLHVWTYILVCTCVYC